jgi:hypothetical protein
MQAGISVPVLKMMSLLDAHLIETEVKSTGVLWYRVPLGLLKLRVESGPS